MPEVIPNVILKSLFDILVLGRMNAKDFETISKEVHLIYTSMTDEHIQKAIDADIARGCTGLFNEPAGPVQTTPDGNKALREWKVVYYWKTPADKEEDALMESVDGYFEKVKEEGKEDDDLEQVMYEFISQLLETKKEEPLKERWETILRIRVVDMLKGWSSKSSASS